LNVADAASRRLRRVTFVGPAQLAPMQKTEALREGEGVKALRIQVPSYRCTTMNVKTAVEVVRRERLRPDSLLLLAKWSVNSRWCPNPQGKFIGCSEMSLEQQKQAGRSERRMTSTDESGMK